MTDGLRLVDVNRTFLEFFDYAALEDFLQNHECICDLFIEDERYYSLKKVPQGYNWINYLEHLNETSRVVLMASSTGELHSFAMQYAQYGTMYIVTFTDISQTMKETIAFEDKAVHDSLTGAYNRAFFDLKIDEILASRGEEHLGIIFFDIDHFKAVNDSFGHDVGDTILKELVEIVMQSTRKNDVLIRWGGEEFILFVVVSGSQELYKIAENLRQKVQAHSFDAPQNITCSFGVTLHEPAESIEISIKRADQALYFSKENGRNRVTLS